MAQLLVGAAVGRLRPECDGYACGGDAGLGLEGAGEFDRGVTEQARDAAGEGLRCAVERERVRGCGWGAGGWVVERADGLVEHGRGVLCRVGHDHLEVVLAVGEGGRGERDVDALGLRTGLLAVEHQRAGCAVATDRGAFATVGVWRRGVDGVAVDLDRDLVDARAVGVGGGERDVGGAVRVRR